LKILRPVVLCLFIFTLGWGTVVADAICEGYHFGPQPVNAILKSGSLLYLGTNNGLMVKDLLSGDILHYHMLNSELKAWQVTCLAQKSNGSIWIGTDSGLFKMELGIIRKYMGSELGRILSLYVDQQDIIWLGTYSWDFYKINQSETLVQINSPGDNPYAICSDQNHTLWLGCNDGLIHWNPATGVQTYYTSANSLLPDDEIKDIDLDSQGNIWVLSKLGLTKIPASGTWQVWGGNYEGPLAFCTQIDVDARDRIWITKSNLLSCLDGYNLQSFSLANLGIEGYPLCSVCCEDSLYYGAWGHYGSFANPGFTLYPLYNTKLLNTNLFSVQKDSMGCLWITYFGDGYTTLEGNNSVHHSLPEPDVYSSRIILGSGRQNYGVIDYNVYLLNGHNWTLLAYTDWIENAFYTNGNAYFNPSGWGVLSYNGSELDTLVIDYPGAYGNYAARLTVNSLGRMWFINNYDLVSYADSSFTVHPLNPDIASITCLSAGNGRELWIGDHDGALWKYDGLDYAEVVQLPVAEEILQIIIGYNSELWIRSARGLFLWHEGRSLSTVIPVAGGTEILNWISLCPDGSIIATTLYGYYIFRDVDTAAWTEELSTSVPHPLCIYPNPGSSLIHIVSHDGKQISGITIYNIKGQVITKLCTSGKAEIVWDGRDQQGRTVANGIYLIEAAYDGKKITRKLVIRK